MRDTVITHPLLRREVLRKLFVGTFLDFSPTLVFVVTYHLSDFFTATGWFMVATVCVALFALRVERRIPYFSLYLSLITLLFGASTLFFQQPHFIQVRDTVYDTVLGLTLLFGVVSRKLFLMNVFSHTIKMTVGAWSGMTYAWICYFLVAALSNEVARKVLQPGDWVIFKVTMLVFTACYGFFVLFYFYEPEDKDILIEKEVGSR